jgi:hypothetical protein
MDAAQQLDDYLKDVPDPEKLIRFQDDMLKALNRIRSIRTGRTRKAGSPSGYLAS